MLSKWNKGKRKQTTPQNEGNATLKLQGIHPSVNSIGSWREKYGRTDSPTTDNHNRII